MGKPKWMIEREEKKEAELKKLNETIAAINANINEAINELYDKVNAIENSNKRALILKETDEIVATMRKTLKDAPTFCFKAKDFEGIYNLVYEQLQKMIETVDKGFEKNDNTR